MLRSLVFCLIVCLTVCPSALAVNGNMGNHDGYVPDGSEASPWLIEDLADFDAFASSANAGLYWGAGEHVKLVCDLDLSGRTYEGSVIGTDKISGYLGVSDLVYTYGSIPLFDEPIYNGIFDGNGHTITDLTINVGDTDKNYLGLFGYLAPDAVVQRLSLLQLSIMADGYVHAIGGLVGFNYGTIFQCMTTGEISNYQCSGGLCGINSGTISQCSSSCDIVGESLAGGLCASNNGRIINCYANGSVSVYYEGGGLIGTTFFDSYVRNCYSLSDMSGFSSLFCDYNLGVIINSYFDSSYYPSSVTSCGAYSIKNLYSPDSIIGWNEGVWKFDYYNYETFYEYPILDWQSATGEFITTDYPHRRYYGQGTQANPFVIWDADDFTNFAQREPDWDKYFVLEENIYLDESFKPVADFSGTFDGQGHTITGLNLIRQDRNIGNYGLFGRVTGTVKNVILEDVRAEGVIISGAISSSLYGGTISNCRVSGDIKSRIYSGGISAICVGGKIENCHFTGTIEGQSYLGGICSVIIHGSIIDSQVQADILGKYYIIGGLCGIAGYGSNIERCFSDSNILINDPYYESLSQSGMIASVSRSTVSNCYSTGSVRRQMTASRTEVAGFGFADSIYGSTVTNCYSDCYSKRPGFDIYCYIPPYLSDQTSDITGCFWNSDKVQESDEYVSGTGITTGQFSDKSIFAAAGWDFMYNKADGTADIWYMSGRPAFSWAKREVMDMEELGLLAASWLCNDCTETDNCSYVDYYPDGVIDLEDLLTLAQNWLRKPDEEYCD